MAACLSLLLLHCHCPPHPLPPLWRVATGKDLNRKELNEGFQACMASAVAAAKAAGAEGGEGA